MFGSVCEPCDWLGPHVFRAPLPHSPVTAEGVQWPSSHSIDPNIIARAPGVLAPLRCAFCVEIPFLELRWFGRISVIICQNFLGGEIRRIVRGPRGCARVETGEVAKEEVLDLIIPALA